MHLKRLKIEEVGAFTSRLLDADHLEGSFNLEKRADVEGRFWLTPAEGETGEFQVTIGRDRELGRITLLRNHQEAIVVLPETSDGF